MNLFPFHQLERRRVHAVPLVGRCRSVIEDMAGFAGYDPVMRQVTQPGTKSIRPVKRECLTRRTPIFPPYSLLPHRWPYPGFIRTAACISFSCSTKAPDFAGSRFSHLQQWAAGFHSPVIHAGVLRTGNSHSGSGSRTVPLFRAGRSPGYSCRLSRGSPG
jgi:hypothetical protein